MKTCFFLMSLVSNVVGVVQWIVGAGNTTETFILANTYLITALVWKTEEKEVKNDH